MSAECRIASADFFKRRVTTFVLRHSGESRNPEGRYWIPGQARNDELEVCSSFAPVLEAI